MGDASTNGKRSSEKGSSRGPSKVRGTEKKKEGVRKKGETGEVWKKDPSKGARLEISGRECEFGPQKN